MLRSGRLRNAKRKLSKRNQTAEKGQINFELPNLTKEFKPGEGQKPFSIGKEYTLSLSSKSNLYKDLVSWRGKPFTEEELEGFDLSKLLGKPCQIQIIHKQGKMGIMQQSSQLRQS